MLENKDISLNQKSSLIDIFRKDEALSKHFDLSDLDEIWNKLEITEKQYRYILYLIFNNKRFKLNSMMVQLGFRRNNMRIKDEIINAQEEGREPIC